MCGIVFAISKDPVRNFIEAAHAMQRHRGPDGEGQEFRTVGGFYVGMAHQRLAIVGLGELGAQPMLSQSGRFRIIFNGEIYNYKELAKSFKYPTHGPFSDTQVMLHVIEQIGISAALATFNGMWAMVVEDLLTNTFYFSRDRFGKKPMYIHNHARGIFVTSELRTLSLLPSVELAIDPMVAGRFLAQSLLNVDERTWLKNVDSLEPGTICEVKTIQNSLRVTHCRAFWNPSLQDDLASVKPADLYDNVKHVVRDAIRLRLQADVSVGIALSGGIDSAILASESVRQREVSGQEPRFLSAVHPGFKDDESHHIDTIGSYLDTEPIKVSLSASSKEQIELLKYCSEYSDGPLASLSPILFFKLMQGAVQHGSTVVLTGQGADEVFCGYRKYPYLQAKNLLSKKEVIKTIFHIAGFLKNRTLISEFNLAEAKRYILSDRSSTLTKWLRERYIFEELSRIEDLSQRQWLDIKQYSVPYLCHYEDRMSMACSREVRSPFLDYRVVELGLSIPSDSKLKSGWTKYCLRKAFSDSLPSSIAWRKDKKGFANPEAKFLRGELGQYILDTMRDENAMVYEHQLVEKRAYLNKLKSYLAGNDSIWFREVFAPFSLELWLRHIASIPKIYA